jgi:hypothetical protein
MTNIPTTTSIGKTCANQMIDQTRHGALDYGTLDNSSLHGVNEVAGFGLSSLSLQLSSTAPYRRAPRPSTAPESFNAVLGLVQVDKKAAKKSAAIPRSQNHPAVSSGPKFFDFSIMRNSSLAQSAENVSRVATRNQHANLEEASEATVALPRMSFSSPRASIETSSALSGESEIPCLSNAENVSQVKETSIAPYHDSMESEVRDSFESCSMIVDGLQISNQVSIVSSVL